MPANVQEEQYKLLTIRLVPDDMQRLKEAAEHIGVGPTVLARMLIRQGLQGQGGESHFPFALLHTLFQPYVRTLRASFRVELENGSTCGCPKAAATCRELLAREAALWTFVRGEQFPHSSRKPAVSLQLDSSPPCERPRANTETTHPSSVIVPRGIT